MIDRFTFFEHIAAQFKKQKPFCAYRKPGATVATLMLQNTYDHFKAENFKDSGFVFAPFNSEDAMHFIPSENAEIFECELPEVLIESEEFDTLADPDFIDSEVGQQSHEQLVQKGIDAIKNGDFRKVVLSRSEKVSLADPDLIPIFKKMLQKYREAFVYCWYHPETGIWMGATPERLLHTERNRFKTMALAGTQVFKGELDVDWEEKELEEQPIVTDFILNSLDETDGITHVKATSPFTKKAGNLLHICTEVSGVFQHDKLQELVKSIHPTPAICGMPRDNALQFIKQEETYDREFYSGFMGELNIKKEIKRNSNRRNQENQQFSAIVPQTDLFVNLRCMKLKDGKAQIFVGGGITKDSDAAKEWQETVNKAQTMKSVLVK